MYSNEGYRALRSGSAVVRRGDRGVLQVSGTDRLVWLQGLLTNDVASLRPGDSCYALYLTPQGRMISDLRVLNLDDRTLLEVPAVLAEPLRVKLDSLLFAEEAHVSDLSASLAAVDVIGPESPSIVARTRTSSTATIHGVIDDGSYGVPASTLLIAGSDVEMAVRELLALGAIETTLETLEVLRIEAGRPLFLVDMDEHTIPLEAGLERRAISFTKGCYVGQEVIVRILQRGHGRVAKRLVGLVLQRDSTPRAGDLVRADEREIGRLTSVVRSPALERPIALGYVHREFVEPGTAVTVATREGAAAATIAPLPFIATGASTARP